jgi:hypothetical protein
MVEAKERKKMDTGRARDIAGKILPIFSKEKVSDLVNEILREDEYIRGLTVRYPQLKEVLYRDVVSNFDKYKGVIRGAKVIDSWDRVTSAAGLAAEVTTGPVGSVFSGVEEIVEGIPKGIYAVYYLSKTKDWKSIPIWMGAELASFIPYVGDAVDLTNIYVDRARKFTKEATKENFKKRVKKDLEGMVQETKAA